MSLRRRFAAATRAREESPEGLCSPEQRVSVTDSRLARMVLCDGSATAMRRLTNAVPHELIRAPKESVEVGEGGRLCGVGVKLTLIVSSDKSV